MPARHKKIFMSLLTLEKVSKAYAGVAALDGATLEVAGGEIHALMGENGAGKSTLIKVLAGVETPDHAEIEMDGKPVTIGSSARAFALGLRFIHQELNVVPALSVAENIFLGRDYPTRLGAFVDWKILADQARKALARLGIDHIDPRMQMAQLGYGDQMLARISGAFLTDAHSAAKLYVMDEPTAALTGEEAERLFKVLNQIRAAGGSVLYVTHRIDEVIRLCDRITILRDGKTIDSGATADTTQDNIVQMMIGRAAGDAYPPPLAAATSEAALEVENLKTGKLKPVSFSIRRGEIVGLAGLSGAGQSEILRALIGGDHASATSVRVNGQPGQLRGPAAAWRAGFAYVPRDRRSEGLVLNRSITQNVVLPHLSDLASRVGFLNKRRERDFASDSSKEVKLRSAGPDQLSFELSGGNQQKVVFAKALAGTPAVLLLDEPTRGVDVGAKFDIYAIIRELSAAGMAVMLASSDLPELIGMCDRILIMRDGALADDIDAKGLTEDILLNHCYGRADDLAALTTDG